MKKWEGCAYGKRTGGFSRIREACLRKGIHPVAQPDIFHRVFFSYHSNIFSPHTKSVKNPPIKWGFVFVFLSSFTYILEKRRGIQIKLLQ